jgi:hypothetical protein
VLVANTYLSYIRFLNEAKFAKIYRYTNQVDTLSIVKQHTSGWIVLGYIAADQITLPKKTIIIDNRVLEYIGSFDYQELWKWSTISNSP